MGDLCRNHWWSLCIESHPDPRRPNQFCQRFLYTQKTKNPFQSKCYRHKMIDSLYFDTCFHPLVVFSWLIEFDPLTLQWCKRWCLNHDRQRLPVFLSWTQWYMDHRLYKCFAFHSHHWNNLLAHILVSQPFFYQSTPLTHLLHRWPLHHFHGTTALSEEHLLERLTGAELQGEVGVSRCSQSWQHQCNHTK